MSYYPPSFIPKADSPNFQPWLRKQLEKISRVTETTVTQVINLVPQHTAPVKPRKGMVAYADGTDWNPGAGEGVYNYNGTSWTKM